MLKDLSNEWDVIIQNCQEKEVSRERDVKVSRERGIQEKGGSKRKGDPRERDVNGKLGSREPGVKKK